MKIKTLYALILIIIVTSCQRDSLFYDDNRISYNVRINSATKSIKENGFIHGEQLAVSVLDQTTNDYYDNSVRLQKITANGELPNQQWFVDNDIKLSPLRAKAIAWFPYQSTTYDNIQVQTDLQTDYMYATCMDLYNKNHQASFQMQHALSSICLTVKRGSYGGAGLVQKIKVSGNQIARNAKLNAATGQLSNVTNVGYIERSLNYIITSTPKSDYLIFVPVNTSGKITITVTMDNQEYTCDATLNSPRQGYCYNYNLTVDNTNMNLSGVSIGDWTYNHSGELEIGSPKVKVKGNLKNIAIATDINPDGSVSIRALPVVKGDLLKEILVTGATSEIKKEGDFTHVKVTGDFKEAIIQFNGITEVFEFTINGNIFKAPEIIESTNNLWNVYIDDELVYSKKTYAELYAITYNIPNLQPTHKVKLTNADATPDEARLTFFAFSDINSSRYATELKSFDRCSFSGLKSLSKYRMDPVSGDIEGINGFGGCQGLENIEGLADCTELEEIGDGCFFYCVKLSSLSVLNKLPIKILGTALTSFCFELQTIVPLTLPQLTTVRDLAFNYTPNLKLVVDFRDKAKYPNLTSMGIGIYRDCDNITLPWSYANMPDIYK